MIVLIIANKLLTNFDVASRVVKAGFLKAVREAVA